MSRIENVVFDGAPGSGTTVAVSLISRKVIDLNMTKVFSQFEQKDVPRKSVVAHFVEQLNSDSSIICDGGFLSERVFWKKELGWTVGPLRKMEAKVEEKTLLIYLHVNPKALAKISGITLKEAEEISRSYIEEYIDCKVPNKMILDASFLPADITLRPVLWVLDKRVRG